MADLIYTPNPASIARFLKHIPSAGVPDKVTYKYLESVGFKSKNDRYLVGALRTLGFIDASQSPTQRWKDYRDKSKSKQVLGDAVRTAYADLFKVYPDAYQKEADTIRNFFSSKSSVADSTLRLAVATFKTLAAESTFDGVLSTAAPKEVARERETEDEPPVAPRMPSLSVAVQVYIDKEMTAKQVDHVFASMAKHLYGKE